MDAGLPAPGDRSGKARRDQHAQSAGLVGRSLDHGIARRHPRGAGTARLLRHLSQGHCVQERPQLRAAVRGLPRLPAARTACSAIACAPW